MAKVIDVLKIETGAGRTLYTKETNPGYVEKLVPQIHHRFGGVRTLEVVQMEETAYYNLDVNQLAIPNFS